MEREDNSHILFDIHIRMDADTGLPLLSEQYKIFELIRAYLHLPFRVAEYGCGKRVSIIIKQLYDLGIPLHALMRGMILENDMSDAALAEKNALRRPHALRADNPVYKLLDFDDEILLRRFENAGIEVDRKARVVRASKYTLHHKPWVQFVFSRSHIFPIVRFWVADKRKVTERVIDPTAAPNGTFAVNEMRNKLKAPEGYIFASTFGDRFRLRLQDLTRAQRATMNGWLQGRNFDELELEDEWALYRHLTGASEGTLGDPATWTYANNIPGLYSQNASYVDKLHVKTQQAVTDSPVREQLAEKTKELIADLDEKSKPVSISNPVYEEFERLCAAGLQLDSDENLTIPDVVKRDAKWSERQLAPLTVLVNIAAYHKALTDIAQRLEDEGDPVEWLYDEEYASDLLDIGIRLRDRIERMADVSRNDEGEIDARTLNPQFNAATISLIRQMEEAGMSVYFDQVGNVHGLLADEATNQMLRDPEVPLEKRIERLRQTTEEALGFHSHIDTVANGGKYDGRLGVLSGVEVAHIVRDLTLAANEIDFDEKLGNCPILVSAYINEEMSFTGVSMPGSAAVAGLATPEEIYPMRNADGEGFGDKLVALASEMKGLIDAGLLKLTHEMFDKREDFSKLPSPTWFLPKHSIERHCEQANILMNARVPLVQAEAIMGIYQEDFYFSGNKAEAAALEMNRRIRGLQEGGDVRDAFANSRLTMGLWQRQEEAPSVKVDHGSLFMVKGESNHAGATSLGNRLDAGVAIAKLQKTFREMVAQHNEQNGSAVLPIIGDVDYLPGKSRNVIPGEAKIALGIVGQGASVACWAEIEAGLNEALAAMIRNGDLHMQESEAVDEIAMQAKVRSSIDVRAPDESYVETFVAACLEILDDVRQEFGVEVTRTTDMTGAPDQEKSPVRLDRSRRVSLLIDQSAGGSHNPYEAERRSVVAAGSIAQFAAWWELARDPHQDIYDVLEGIIPDAWQRSLGSFCSGALHDTCNVVDGIERRSQSGPPTAVYGEADASAG